MQQLQSVLLSTLGQIREVVSFSIYSLKLSKFVKELCLSAYQSYRSELEALSRRGSVSTVGGDRVECWSGKSAPVKKTTVVVTYTPSLDSRAEKG